MTRKTIGLRAICARCGLELRYEGAGVWYDRGGNIRCHLPADAERLNPKGRHTPVSTHTMLLRRSFDIEVPRPRKGRPSFVWVTGWEVMDPRTRRYSMPMRYREALNFAAQLHQQATGNTK